MKKLTVLFLALITYSLSLGGTILLSGTSVGDTTYDVNKVWQNDDMLCWAAAGSNAIKYWQNSYISHGYALPEGTPAGSYSDPYVSDIFKTFYDNWTNAGGFAENAMQWWFDGTVPLYEAGTSELKPGASEGSYYSDVFDFQGIGEVFTTFDFSEEYANKDDLKSILDELIAWDIPMTASIYSHGGGHAITIWGYEYDDALNEISGIWITDSDDNIFGNLLIDIAWNEDDSLWYLQDYYETYDYGLGSITALDIGFAVPEPSAFTAIFGSLVLVFAVCYRRK